MENKVFNKMKSDTNIDVTKQEVKIAEDLICEYEPKNERFIVTKDFYQEIEDFVKTLGVNPESFDYMRNFDKLPLSRVTYEYSVSWRRGEEPYYPFSDRKNIKI